MSEKREHQTSKERSKANKNSTNGGRSAKLKATLRAAAIVLPQQLLHTGMGIPPAPSISPVVKEGYLMKLEHKPPLGTIVWRKRFCILSRGNLYYYKNEHSDGADKSCGCLVLSEFSRCQPSSSSHATAFSKGKGGGLNRSNSTKSPGNSFGRALLQRSASAHNNSKLRAHLKSLNPTLSSGGASLEEGKMKSEVDDVDVDAETAGSQFTLFPMDPSKRRKLYEYGNVTFVAPSPGEMTDWVLQIQRFIYEGDGCSHSEITMDLPAESTKPQVQQSVSTTGSSRADYPKRENSPFDMTTDLLDNDPLTQTYDPRSSKETNNGAASKGGGRCTGELTTSAYAYSSSDDDSDSLEESLSPNLISEAIGKFQLASQGSQQQPVYGISRAILSRTNGGSASGGGPLVSSYYSNSNRGESVIKTLNEDEAGSNVDESDGGDPSGLNSNYNTPPAAAMSYQSRQGPYALVRRQQPQQTTKQHQIETTPNIASVSSALCTGDRKIIPSGTAADNESGELSVLVTRLERSCHLIRNDLTSAKSDLANVNAGLCNIQNTADQVVEKLNKFNLKMFDLENQSALMMKSLSQKGALLDTKLAEVDLCLNRLRSMGLGGPSSTELLLSNKPQHRNSMLTPGSGGGDQGGNFGSLPTAAINSSRNSTKSKNRHSVQICQDPTHNSNDQYSTTQQQAHSDKRSSLYSDRASLSLPSPKSNRASRALNKTTTEIAFI